MFYNIFSTNKIIAPVNPLFIELLYSAHQCSAACQACQGVDDDDNGDAGPGVQVVTVTPGMSPPCDS